VNDVAAIAWSAAGRRLGGAGERIFGERRRPSGPNAARRDRHADLS
jgi:hypothetical protein